jgi:hypothetical protein
MSKIGFTVICFLAIIHVPSCIGNADSTFTYIWERFEEIDRRGNIPVFILFYLFSYSKLLFLTIVTRKIADFMFHHLWYDTTATSTKLTGCQKFYSDSYLCLK